MGLKGLILVIWNYMRDSWEDTQGRLSYKRLSQFIWSWLIVFMVVTNKVQGQWTFYVFLTLTLLFATTGLLITIPQLISLVKSSSFLSKFGSTTDPGQPKGLDEIKDKDSLNK